MVITKLQFKCKSAVLPHSPSEVIFPPYYSYAKILRVILEIQEVMGKGLFK